jgi:hypothetical protein
MKSMFKPAYLVLVLISWSVISYSLVRASDEPSVVEAKKPDKPNRHDRHKHDEIDVPPVPIPPKPDIKPEPDPHFHVTPLPQPEPHVKPVSPDKPVKPGRVSPLIHLNDLLGWVTPSHYTPSIYDALLFAGLIVVGVVLIRRE